MPISRRRLITLGAFAVAAVGVPYLMSQRKVYAGPISDHFDGLRFFDPEGAPPKAFSDIVKWWAENGKQKWPARVPSPFSDIPPQRVTQGVRLSFVGHASWLIQTAGLNILVDPVWSQRASPFTFAGPLRVNDPGIAFDALPPIDAV